MIERKRPSAREKIAGLRRTFLAQLPDRLAQARALAARLDTDFADSGPMVELHRVLHNLKGTGTSFGFRDLGDVVGSGERLLAACLEHPENPPECWRGELAACIEAMDQAALAACASDTGESCPLPLDVALLPEGLQERDRRGGRLLYICDDDPLTLEKLSSQLNCFGYETRTFLDPDAVRAAVRDKRPDALVLDIHFPQGRDAGIVLLQSLRQETAGGAIPAVFLSGRDDFAARMAAVQAGGDAYFHKPAQISELVAALDQLTHLQQPAPYRVLIVDDEPEVASYHAIILQEAGMITRQLGNPARVLEVLREFMPDMVLMDLYMPGCDGQELAKLIRQVPNLVGLPIVYLSGEPDRKKQFSAMRVGADGFMTKPVAPEELVATVAIVAERMRILRSLMARDSLTGLFNHTTTTHLLRRALATARRNEQPLCFAMLDLDRFKLVNDTHGHLVGDQVLLALSRVLRQRLRNEDVIGRYGGEEFAVIFQNTPADDAVRLIDELRRNFARIVFHSSVGPFRCTLSAGIAAYPACHSMEALREAADRALYAAKRGGRDCVVLDAVQAASGGRG